MVILSKEIKSIMITMNCPLMLRFLKSDQQ